MEKFGMMNAPITNMAQPTTTNVPTEKQAVEETETKDDWQWEGSEEEAEYLEFEKAVMDWIKELDEDESSNDEDVEDDDEFVSDDEEEDEED